MYTVRPKLLAYSPTASANSKLTMISLFHRLKTSLGRGNRRSLCEDQLQGAAGLVSSSAIVEVRPSGLVQPVADGGNETDSNLLSLKLPKHLRIEQSRPFSITAGCLPEQADFQAILDSDSAATDLKSSNSPTSLKQLQSQQLLSHGESTLDRGTRSRRGSSIVLHSREGSISEILDVDDDSVGLTPLLSLIHI